MKYLSLLVLLFGPLLGGAQEILGNVVDNTKEPVVNASVTLKQGGVLKDSTITDFDGIYSFKSLGAGLYEITVSYLTCKTSTVTDIIVTANEKTSLNFILPHGNPKDSITTKYKKPLIDKYKTSNIISAEELKKMPRVPTIDLIATPGIYKQEIKGQITNAKNLPIGGAVIGLRKAGTAQNTYLTDSNGRYSIQAIDTGNYEITIIREGYKYLSVQTVVTRGQKTTLNIILRKKHWAWLQKKKLYVYPI